MANYKTFLKNASTKHSIYLQRFASGQRKTMHKALQQIKDILTIRLANQQLSTYNRQRLLLLYQTISADLKNTYGDFTDKFAADMTDYAAYEAEFSRKMFDKVVKAEVNFSLPNDSQLQAAVFTNPLLLTTETLNVKSALNDFTKAKTDQIINLIKDGVVTGQTNQEILRDTISTVETVQVRQAASLISTIVNHISSEARLATMQENKDIINGYQWVSVLDDATTIECAALDGETYSFDEDFERPPLHWNCRSTIIPTIEYRYIDSNDFGDVQRPAVGDEGAETVTGNVTYNSWLKEQSSEFQKEVLGDTRAALFANGGLNLKGFVDEQHVPYTLDELRLKEPQAFSKAGL